MSAEAYSYYLSKILEDYGTPQLEKSLKALRLHLDYRRNGETEKIYNRFRGMLFSIGEADLKIDETPKYYEGKNILKIHATKERNTKIASLAKLKFYQHNSQMECEVCGFSFRKAYGEHGLGFIEAHHKTPISHLKEETEVRIEDFAMLCANCHRMIHRRIPWLSVAELKEKIINEKKQI